MGKDSKGINRGKCSKPDCNCVDFLYKEDKGIKCSNCGHVPIAHAETRFEILKPPDGFLESASEDEIDDEEIEEKTYENVNDDFTHQPRHQPAGSSMDIQGTLRGECTFTGCKCRQFSYIVQQGPKCSGCGHAPVKHTAEGANMPKVVNKRREEDELEKDSAPPQLFIKPQNRSFSSPLRSSFNTSVSDLSIADIEEEDTTDSMPVGHMHQFRPKRRLLMKHEPEPIRSRYMPMDSSTSETYPTVFPQSMPPNQSTIDNGMVPLYNPRAVYQHNTVLSAEANLATQNLPGIHALQQQQPFTLPTNSMPINSMATNSMALSTMATNSTVANPVFTGPAPPPPLTIPQPPVQQQKICKLDGCNKPVCVENGRVHDFCGRTHAVAFKSAGIPANLKCTNPSCARMKYQENGKYLDFCGRSCRDSYRKAQQQQPAPSAGPQVSPANTCLLPGCKLQKYFDTKTNTYFDYCGKNHASQAQKTLIQKASKQEFDRIKAHFTKQWDPRKGACGQLHEVLVITNLKLKNQFEKYRSSLSVNKVSQHYHGTSLKCTIYQSFTVCSDEACGICGVCQKGMLPNFKATNITFQRFGNGFYLAPNSSKCHDYTRGYDKYRAMLLFDVAEGNKYVVKNDQTKLKAAPQGYDSVYGQSGSALNYDEIVLYKSEALLPTHILVYMKDGIHKIAK